MSQIIVCDLCGKKIDPVSPSDSLMANYRYGDRIEVQEVVTRSFWERLFGGGVGLAITHKYVDVHPECLSRLFKAKESA